MTLSWLTEDDEAPLATGPHHLVDLNIAWAESGNVSPLQLTFLANTNLRISTITQRMGEMNMNMSLFKP